VTNIERTHHLTKVLGPRDAEEPVNFSDFVATYRGQAAGWYGADEEADLIGATVEAIIILLIWAAVARPKAFLKKQAALLALRQHYESWEL